MLIGADFDGLRYNPGQPLIFFIDLEDLRCLPAGRPQRKTNPVVTGMVNISVGCGLQYEQGIN